MVPWWDSTMVDFEKPRWYLVFFPNILISFPRSGHDFDLDLENAIKILEKKTSLFFNLPLYNSTMMKLLVILSIINYFMTEAVII